MAAKKINGFSLLEILIAMFLVGVLLALAIPSYQKYAVRSQRSDAVREIMSLAACLERTRAVSMFYDTQACQPKQTPYYELRIEPVAERTSEYSIHATPRAANKQDHCGTLSINHLGSRTTSGDAAGWAQCWGGR